MSKSIRFANGSSDSWDQHYERALSKGLSHNEAIIRADQAIGNRAHRRARHYAPMELSREI